VIILDTNVLSELMRGQPTAQVVDWIAARPAESLFTTTITQAEVLFGVAILPSGRKRSALQAAVRALFDVDFAQRVLPFDAAAADAFATIAARRQRAGRPISQFDALIAGVALSRDATLATRNEGDFVGCGIDVVNPWQR